MKDAVNAIVWNGVALSAEVGLASDFNLASVTARKIIVCPTALSREIDTRGNSTGEATITIALLEKVTPADLDNRIELAETIGATLEKATLAFGQCVGVEYSPLYDIQQYCQTRVFQSVINVTVRMVL